MDPLSISLRWRRSLGLTLAIAIISGIGLVEAGLHTLAYRREKAEVEASASITAGAALGMLAAVHTQAMKNRTKITDGDPVINTLNGTMDQYSKSGTSVRLWMVMGDKIVAFQRHQKAGEIEGPRDSVDRDTLDQRQPQRRIVDGRLRQTLPVVLGQGQATEQDCGRCHTRLMGIKAGETLGAYSADMDLAPAYAELRESMWREGGITIAVTLLLAGLIMALLSIIALRPLDRLRKSTAHLADGEYDTIVEGQDRRDEIGAVARTLELLRATLALGRQNEQRLSEERTIAARLEREAMALNMTMEQGEEFKRARHEAQVELSHKFEQSVAEVVDAVRNASLGLANSAEQLIAAATGASEEASMIAAASTRAADNVNAVASATRGLSQSIRTIAEQVVRQAELAELANGQSERGALTVERLTDRTRDIRGILSLVQSVAGQTNLLALNATIEAARAGEAGRGFAVVAGEVKALAAQTSSSACQIDSLIDAVGEEVGQTVDSITQVASALGEVRGIAARLAQTVSEQRDVASGISNHAETAADGAEQVNRSIVGLAAASRQANDMAVAVGAMSHELQAQAERLNQATRDFVVELRSDRRGERDVAA